MRVILINGPPHSGKDTAGQMIVERWPGGCARISKLAQELKERTHGAYGMGFLSHDSYEGCKDTPLVEFMGLTPRQAYIAMSEKFLKPLHGCDVLGHLLLRRLDTTAGQTCAVVTDSGFREEAEVLVRRFGPQDVTLIRLHRPGCSYEGDSRGFIDLSDMGVRCVDVTNDGSLVSLLEKLREALPGELR